MTNKTATAFTTSQLVLTTKPWLCPPHSTTKSICKSKTIAIITPTSSLKKARNPTPHTQPASSKTISIPAPTAPLFVERTFNSLGLSPILTQAITHLGITHPTGIQARGIPTILHGIDVIIGAATGSGKTLTYLLPVMQQLKNEEALQEEDTASKLFIKRRPRALIITPTRELAEQVFGVARELSHTIKLRVVCAIGGGGGAGERVLKKRLDGGGVDIMVCTPGRLEQLVDTRSVDVRFCAHVVMDEVDTLFDGGFGPGLRKVLNKVGVERKNEGGKTQFIAVGATHPRVAREVYTEMFPRAKTVNVDLHRAPKGLEQRFVETTSEGKIHELMGMLRGFGKKREGRVMVFCNTVESCRFVGYVLEEAGMGVCCIHGEMPAMRRELEFGRFKNGEAGIVVCTDMAARGLDDVEVGHVILFDFPTSAVDYLHRAGRTARAGMKGRVSSLILKKDERLARVIQSAGREREDALEAVGKVGFEVDRRRMKREVDEEGKKKKEGRRRRVGTGN